MLVFDVHKVAHPISTMFRNSTQCQVEYFKSGKWIPAFTSCDHDLVGMWLFIVEKAFAKIHGSYEAAFTAKYEFQELLAIFTGGLPFTFHNTVLKSIDSNPHFNVPNDDGFTLSPFPGINTTDSFIDIIRAIR